MYIDDEACYAVFARTVSENDLDYAYSKYAEHISPETAIRYRDRWNAENPAPAVATLTLTREIGYGMHTRTTACFDCGILLEYIVPNPNPAFDAGEAVCYPCELDRDAVEIIESLPSRLDRM